MVYRDKGSDFMLNIISPDDFYTHHVYDGDRHVADIYYEPEQRKPWKGYIGQREVFSCRSYDEAVAIFETYFYTKAA